MEVRGTSYPLTMPHYTCWSEYGRPGDVWSLPPKLLVIAMHTV